MERPGRLPAAVIFDLDGTLVDTVADLRAATNAMLTEIGRRSLTEPEVQSFVGNGASRLIARALSVTGGGGGEIAEQALARFSAIYAAAPVRHSRTYPGVRTALATLMAEGAMLGICTNKPHALALAVIEGFGLGNSFAVVQGAGETAALKPDPAALRSVLARMDVDPEDAAFVGDSEVDWETARGAGIPFALFTGGYRRRPAERFTDAMLFDHHRDLPRLLRGG